jgi:hypothetical protein
MKITKLLSTLFITGLIISAINTSVSAKTTSIDVTGTDGKVYEYQFDALKTSSVSYMLNGATDSNAKLYNDFVTRKVSVNAYYDDVKSAYVDSATVSSAAVSTKLNGKTFVLDDFTSATTTPTTVITPTKVTVNNGNILIDGQEQNTGLVDMSSLTFDTTTVPYTTLISFKLNVTNQQDYTVKVKGIDALFSTTGNKFGVSLNGTLSANNFTQSDFVITKKTDNTSTPLADISSLVLDIKTVPKSTIMTFKLNVTDPQDYNVTVKGKIATFSSISNYFGVAINGTLTISDFTTSDFVIAKKNETGNDDISQYTVTVENSSTISAFQKVTVTLPSNVDFSQYDVTIKGQNAEYTDGKFSVTLIGYNLNQDSVRQYIQIKKKNTSSTATITKIDNINDTVLQNASYTLPTSIVATMSDESYQTVTVVWDKSVDTSQIGTFTFNGTVSGYSSKVVLTLNIQNNIQNLIPSWMKLSTNSTDTIYIQWQSIDNIDGYHLYYSSNGQNWNSFENGTLLNSASASLSGVSNGSTIYFKVSSVKNKSEIGSSNVYNITMVTNQDTTKCFPLMSDVPQPNYNYAKYVNDKGDVFYYYNPLSIPKTFFDEYVVILKANGWKYYSSRNSENGTLMLFYYKGNNLVELTVIGNYAIIAGNIR